ncbi:tail fiber assembly protein [Escherichia coli]|uniref:tail fiber assembly protein n=1 Tax=Citrobacter amalonaticus TaxID=35703 RepID=UPI00181A7F92|nr:tail fiber assembly protein [Citrobacter amalonaticus]EFH1753563.1 tail fiber assembly protein [Escherichia coli]MBJ8735817.1 tail fiber assembly protein [Citrobacter amalonaticus]
MKNFIFSALNNAFYPLELQSRYVEAGSWPEDGIEVNDEIFKEFTGEPPVGKVRGVKDGFPCWIDVPPPTRDELIAAAVLEKQVRTGQTNDYINDKQWPGKAAIGRLKGDELAQYNLWLDYLDALEAVDTTSAPDINWPVPPEA